MKRLFLPLLAIVAVLAGCRKDPIVEVGYRDELRTISDAKNYFARQIAGGVMVQSTTRLTDSKPGGWRMAFTGGAPSTVDLLNGTDPENGLTPKLVVRHKADGSTVLWVEENDVLVDPETRGVTLTGPITSRLETAIPPKLDVRKDDNGVLTVWYNDLYGYPDDGWKNTGVHPQAGSREGSEAESGPILAIIDNEARGVVAVWLNDEEHTGYTFQKFSPAYRMNVMNNQLDVREGAAGKVLMIVSPSEAWVPTGAGEWIGRWALNDPDVPEGTRAGYVQICPNCTVESILPSERGMGEYVVTIRSNIPNFNMSDRGDVHSLVLNTNTEEVPKLVSSTRFIINSLLPEYAANCDIIKPGDTRVFTMSQVVREFRAGFVSRPRIATDDNVTVDWVWAGKPGMMTPAGIVADIEVTTPENSGLNSRFTVTAGQTEGNAVVAAKVNGTIVWSWHIWVTNYNPETDYKTYESKGPASLSAPDAGKVHRLMDRNLGALSNTHLSTGDESAFGMFYQWGRKDPLPGAWYQSQPDVLPTIYMNDPAAGGETATTMPRTSPSVTAGVRYSVEHPAEFIYMSSSLTGVWSWNDLSLQSLAALWYDGTDVSSDVQKSVYDPCPAGWRLPSKGVLEGFQPTEDKDTVLANQGHLDTPYGYIPYAGYMDYLGNIQTDVGRYAFYTSQKDVPVWISEWAGGVRLETSGGNQTSKFASNAYSVRCIKEII